MARPAGLTLDYGNVLTRAQGQAWMDGAARRRHRRRPGRLPAAPARLHADLPAAEYWRRVLAASRPGAGALNPVDLAWLVEADVASWDGNSFTRLLPPRS